MNLRCPLCGAIQIVDDAGVVDSVPCRGCSATLKVPRPQPSDVPVATSAPSNPFAENSPIAKTRAIETQNPYQAPATGSVFSSPRQNGPYYGAKDPRLANRWKRFLGAMIDGLFYIVMALVVVFGAVGGPGGLDLDQITLIVSALGLMIFCVQAFLISTRGQSLGKIVLGTRIVRVETDETVGFLHGVLLRAIVPALIGIVPLVGR